MSVTEKEERQKPRMSPADPQASPVSADPVSLHSQVSLSKSHLWTRAGIGGNVRPLKIPI